MSKKPVSVKKQVKFAISMVWIGALLAVLSRYTVGWLLWAGLVLVVAGGILRYCFICCPHCRHKLNDGNGVPSRCPHCGENLE